MGNLTAAEKQRVLDTLDKMDRSTIERILGSIESFTNWLRDSLYSVYVKVKDLIYGVWVDFCETLNATAKGIIEGVKTAEDWWRKNRNRFS